MGCIAVKQLLQHLGQVLSDACDRAIALVVQAGEPMLMAVPIGGAGLDSAAMRPDLPVAPVVRHQVGIGVTTSIAGLALSELFDDLGRRRVSAIRTSAEDPERELEAFGPSRRSQRRRPVEGIGADRSAAAACRRPRLHFPARSDTARAYCPARPHRCGADSDRLRERSVGRLRCRADQGSPP